MHSLDSPVGICMNCGKEFPLFSPVGCLYCGHPNTVDKEEPQMPEKIRCEGEVDWRKE